MTVSLTKDDFIGHMMGDSAACKEPDVGRMLAIAARMVTGRCAEDMTLTLIERLASTDNGKEADALMGGLRRAVPKAFDSLRQPPAKSEFQSADPVGAFIDNAIGYLDTVRSTGAPKVGAVIDLLQKHSGRAIDVAYTVPNHPKASMHVHQVLTDDL